MYVKKQLGHSEVSIISWVSAFEGGSVKHGSTDASSVLTSYMVVKKVIYQHYTPLVPITIATGLLLTLLRE